MAMGMKVENKDMNERYLSKTSTAKYLGISRQKLYDMIGVGKFGPLPIRLDGMERFDAQEVDEWMHATNPPTTRKKWQELKKKT
jgi:predicted DNA-binding transcriptional regulator AlpA